MGSPRPTQPPPLDELAERAARVRAMLTRWETDDVSSEPEWNVETIEPMQLESTPTPPKSE